MFTKLPSFGDFWLEIAAHAVNAIQMKSFENFCQKRNVNY